MKKSLVTTAVILVTAALTLTDVVIWNTFDSQHLNGYATNEALKTIKPGWPGNSVDQKGRFMDERNPFLPRVIDLFKWKLGRNEFEQRKRDEHGRLEVKDPSEFLATDTDGILWLGHASFYIRVNGVGILADPVFGHPPIGDRFVSPPSPLAKIRDVDYVLLSHDHRDHMDEETLRAVASRFPNVSFLAGLRSEDVLNEWKTETNLVRTAGWFQQFDLNEDAVRIYFMPVRHWSLRGLLDMNARLWGSYVIQSGSASIYFGGDSGYGPHYREIGELFPKIDYFLIGIGAYEPRWIMEPNHNTPVEAVRAFQDAGAGALIPMHYGTFDMSDEPPSLPLTTLLAEAGNAGVLDRVRPLAVNESIVIK